jgi:hypothetical protein
MRPPLHPRYWFVPFEAAEKTDLDAVHLDVISAYIYAANAAASHTSPSADSPDGFIIRDVLGNKSDTSFSGGSHNPSVMGHLRAAYYHVHGNSFTIPDNAPVTVAPGNGAYVYGAPVEIGTYATASFDVHWVQVSDMDDNGYYNLQLCNVDGTVIYGKTSMFRDGNFVQEGNVPIQISPAPKGTVMYATIRSKHGQHCSYHCSKTILSPLR